MPLPLLVAHVRMLPRLDAAEALEHATRSSLPFMTDSARNEQVRAWRDAAQPGRRAQRPRTREELLLMAAQHGIGVEVRKR